MKFRVVASEVAAMAIEHRQDKLFGLPARGTQIGSGRPMAIQDSWDSSGAVPPGWGSYRGSRIQHPTLSQWAVPIDPETAAALANGRAQRLTAQERADMAADLAASVASLPGEWFPDGAGVAVPSGGRRP